MPVFEAKVRTMQSYLAGAGASGALLAGAFMMFVILVGVATFDSWPRAGGLFPRGADVTLWANDPATPAPSPSASGVVRLLDGKGAGVRGHGGLGGVGGRGKTDGELGGNEDIRVGTEPQGPGQNTSVQPSAPSTTQSRNVLQQTVSNVGNAVESNTTSLGNDLSAGTSPQVGGLVTGLGSSVNTTLQTLSGNR
jgi:hypothetical protein